MPAPFSSRPVRLRRRTALGGLLGLGAVAAGCTGTAERDPEARTGRPRSPETDPDVALAATVVTAEQEVLDLVRATLARHHRLRPVLMAAAEGHAKHVRLLEDAVPRHAPSPSASASVPAHVPSDPVKALGAVARAEDRLTLVDKRSAFSAQSGAFARILASMAAAAAQQATLLRGATRQGAGR